jgi:GT2 family glycosyltransferase
MLKFKRSSLPMQPRISVIIPVYRDWSRLASCLDALAGQTLSASDFEIIVANNEATNDPPPFDLPGNARIVHEPRPGSYAARNAAIAVARGRHFAFTDSDCIPAPDWLETGLRYLTETPDLRLTGPIPVFREAGTRRLVYLYEFHTAFKQKQIATLGHCATANMMVSRETFDRVGPFNEKLVSGGDAEWGDRAHRDGIGLFYAEDFIVSHPARRTLGEILRKQRRLAGSMAQRKGYPTFRYFVRRMLPPVAHFNQRIVGSGRGRLAPVDKAALFLVHWRVQVADAFEYLKVSKGWKGANRT